jgi:transposase
MLIAGECDTLGPRQAAETFGFSKSRYYQIRKTFRLHGAKALASQKRGPKRQYRRTQEVTRQVIRHRFLDPDATAEVIAQKIRQTGLKISTRSVERVIEDFGLQKKLHRYHPQPEAPVAPIAPKNERNPNLATRPAWNAAYGSFSPTRSVGTWSDFGSLYRNTYGWEPGTSCAVGLAPPPPVWSRAWPSNWSTRQLCA